MLRQWDITGTLMFDSGANKFRGDVQTTSGAMTGRTVGRFYGPNAEELGGLLDLASPDGQSGLTGAYGAARGIITP